MTKKRKVISFAMPVKYELRSRRFGLVSTWSVGSKRVCERELKAIQNTLTSADLYEWAIVRMSEKKI